MQGSVPQAVKETHLEGVKLRARGKVRDIYDLGDKLLIVATDRLSAFDYVLPNPIPDKGKVLNQISEFWFREFAEIVPNHMVSTEIADFPAELHRFEAQLVGRSTLAKKLDMLPIECVARGYLSGSGWKEYCERRTVCGIALPAGLRESEQLPEPIFTPATKAVDGHDENISFDKAVELIGPERAEEARSLTLQLYSAGAALARERNIIIADTKFEFGLDGALLVLGDEALTPDSSRFWPADQYEPGRGQASFDKQFVRDYLESIGWDKQPPVPELPEEIVAGSRSRYLEIFEILTGHPLR